MVTVFAVLWMSKLKLCNLYVAQYVTSEVCGVMLKHDQTFWYLYTLPCQESFEQAGVGQWKIYEGQNTMNYKS